MKILPPNKKAFIQNLYKSYTEGIYSDTPQNRKLGRVGMTYSQYAEKKYKEDEGGDKKRNYDKKYYQEEIKKLAEKAYKSGKKAIPFSDEDTRNLVKEAEEEWGLNFSSDICEIWTDTYHKLLFSDMVKVSKEKKESGNSVKNEEEKLLIFTKRNWDKLSWKFGVPFETANISGINIQRNAKYKDNILVKYGKEELYKGNSEKEAIKIIKDQLIKNHLEYLKFKETIDNNNGGDIVDIKENYDTVTEKTGHAAQKGTYNKRGSQYKEN